MKFTPAIEVPDGGIGYRGVSTTCPAIACAHCGATEARMEKFMLHWPALRLHICCETRQLPRVSCSHLETRTNSAGSPVCLDCGQTW